MARKQNKVGVVQVAKACGVSPMTVSRALRGDGRVAAETRQRILAVAEEMEYRPRVRMGRPRGEAARTRPVMDLLLGISIAPESTFYTQLLSNIERELGEHGCDCMIRTGGRDYDQFLALCETLRASEPPAGTLVIGYFPLRQLQTILEIRPQTILVDHTGDPALEAPYACVGFDNVEAARMAIRHLIDSGCKRILLLKGDPAHHFSRDIEQGYGEILREREIALDRKLIVDADFTPEAARNAVLQALDGKISFDGIFTTDEMAFGVLQGLRERGVSVPGEVAVMGCDGLPMGQYSAPPLSTVALDYRNLARVAVEGVLGQMEDGESPSRRVQLVPKLLIRQSTRI